MLKLRTSIEQLAAKTREGKQQQVLFVVPPNNKCSGPLYELVFMMETWLRREGLREQVALTYATYEKGYIQAFGPRLNETVEKEFQERGIAGYRQWVVAAIEPGRAHSTDGSSLFCDLLISFPPYVASTTFEALPHDDRGFLQTDPKSRQVSGFPDIYAIGDTGDFPVKQAFLALLQADAAAEHLSERLLGVPPEAEFDPVSMCIMEQFDRATFAQVPLRTTGDPALPVVVREEALEEYKVGTGEIWRVGKKLLGTILPYRFREGLPFHAGTTWATMELGLKAMARVFAH
jgi:sulfide:quinone oxidoreductase